MKSPNKETNAPAIQGAITPDKALNQSSILIKLLCTISALTAEKIALGMKAKPIPNIAAIKPNWVPRERG